MEKLQQNNKEKSQYLPKEKKLNKKLILINSCNKYKTFTQIIQNIKDIITTLKSNFIKDWNDLTYKKILKFIFIKLVIIGIYTYFKLKYLSKFYLDNNVLLFVSIFFILMFIKIALIIYYWEDKPQLDTNRFCSKFLNIFILKTFFSISSGLCDRLQVLKWVWSLYTEVTNIPNRVIYLAAPRNTQNHMQLDFITNDNPDNANTISDTQGNSTNNQTQNNNNNYNNQTGNNSDNVYNNQNNTTPMQGDKPWGGAYGAKDYAMAISKDDIWKLTHKQFGSLLEDAKANLPPERYTNRNGLRSADIGVVKTNAAWERLYHSSLTFYHPREKNFANSYNTAKNLYTKMDNALEGKWTLYIKEKALVDIIEGLKTKKD